MRSIPWRVTHVNKSERRGIIKASYGCGWGKIRGSRQAARVKLPPIISDCTITLSHNNFMPFFYALCGNILWWTLHLVSYDSKSRSKATIECIYSSLARLKDIFQRCMHGIFPIGDFQSEGYNRELCIGLKLIREAQAMEQGTWSWLERRRTERAGMAESHTGQCVDKCDRNNCQKEQSYWMAVKL